MPHTLDWTTLHTFVDTHTVTHTHTHTRLHTFPLHPLHTHTFYTHTWIHSSHTTFGCWTFVPHTTVPHTPLLHIHMSSTHLHIHIHTHVVHLHRTPHTFQFTPVDCIGSMGSYVATHLRCTACLHLHSLLLIVPAGLHVPLTYLYRLRGTVARVGCYGSLFPFVTPLRLGLWVTWLYPLHHPFCRTHTAFPQFHTPHHYLHTHLHTTLPDPI